MKMKKKKELILELKKVNDFRKVSVVMVRRHAKYLIV